MPRKLKGRNRFGMVYVRYDELVKTAAKRISHVAFLRSDKSGPDIDGSRPNCAIFGKKYKLFKEGKLLLTDMRRVRQGKFDEVAEKLISYITLRARLYKSDKCGLSWADLRILDRFQARLRRQRLQNLTSRRSSAPTLHRFFPTVASAAVATDNMDTGSDTEEQLVNNVLN